MMLPFIRTASLVIRVFTRPLINYIKRKELKRISKDIWLRNTLYNIGQNSHSNSIKLQRRFNRTAGPYAHIRPLSETDALERGAERVGAIAIYGTLLTFG